VPKPPPPIRPQPLPEGTVHLWHEGILFIGTGIRNTLHRHFTASLVFALDGVFAFRGDRGRWRTLRGMAVAPNVAQQMDCRGARVVILQIDPETEAYERMARLFAERGPVVELSDAVVDRLAAAAAVHVEPGFDPVALWTRGLEEVAGSWQTPMPIDTRIAQAMDLIKRAFPRAPSVATLAGAVGLSPGRLTHLWKDEVGIALRRYILWLRLRHVIARVSVGDSLTDAAHDAGFADSAHLSRTFSSMFGLPLSRLFGPAARVRLLLKLPDAELSGPHGPYDRERWEAARSRRGIRP
jgi:AraC-like DNA-binding protein